MTHPHDSRPAVSAAEALQRLEDGNRRFLDGRALPHHPEGDPRKSGPGQHPYATILCCSDSRVPPESIFDAGFGGLFIVRVAGNVLSQEIAGSLQYAGTHLQTELFVVMGHDGCGAIQAALDTLLHDTRHLSRIQALVGGIIPGLTGIDPNLPPSEQLPLAIEANVRHAPRQSSSPRRAGPAGRRGGSTWPEPCTASRPGRCGSCRIRRRPDPAAAPRRAKSGR